MSYLMFNVIIMYKLPHVLGLLLLWCSINAFRVTRGEQT